MTHGYMFSGSNSVIVPILNRGILLMKVFAPLGANSSR